jgi:hypothetical protein
LERREGKREEKTKREEEGKKRRRETVSYSEYSVKTIGKYSSIVEIGG